MNFLDTAEKDFGLFSQRLNEDFFKYTGKLKDEAVTYELKTKASLIAKEAEKLLKTNPASPKRMENLASFAKSQATKTNLQKSAKGKKRI